MNISKLTSVQFCTHSALILNEEERKLRQQDADLRSMTRQDRALSCTSEVSSQQFAVLPAALNIENDQDYRKSVSNKEVHTSKDTCVSDDNPFYL